jgi:hypothetical protein
MFDATAIIPPVSEMNVCWLLSQRIIDMRVYRIYNQVEI